MRNRKANIKSEEALKVVHILNDANAGGAEKLLLSLIEIWNAQGVSQKVILLNGRGDLLSNFLRITEVIELNIGYKFNLVKLIKAIINIKRNTRRADVVQSWLYMSNMFSSIVGFNNVIFWGIHASDFKISELSSLGRAAFVLSKILSFRENIVKIYCSGPSFEYHKKVGFSSKLSFVVNNGISFPDVQYLNGFSKTSDVFRFVCVARHHAQKDIPTLLRAYKSLVDGSLNCDVSLTLVGAGMTIKNDTLMNQIEVIELDVKNDNIYLEGYKENIYEQIVKADCLVLPSCYGEALPLIILESLSVGLPVLTSDLPSLVDLKISNNVEDEFFLIFEKENSVDLCNKMKQKLGHLFNSEQKLLMIEKIRRRYDIESCASKYVGIWKTNSN